MKKYYIYAGYYELWICDTEIGKPLTYMCACPTLSDAIDCCLDIDEDACICYSNSIKSQVAEHFGFLDEEDMKDIPFFDEQRYSPLK